MTTQQLSKPAVPLSQAWSKCKLQHVGKNRYRLENVPGHQLDQVINKLYHDNAKNVVVVVTVEFEAAPTGLLMRKLRNTFPTESN
jgi:hypothetical protein